MNELIKQINESDTFLRLLEVGAGVPIANNLYACGGASKTIFSTESYYSREAFDRMFGVNDFRAVSAEKLKTINDNIQVKQDIKDGLYNTILSNTFQIGGITNRVSTHGWFSLNIGGDNIRYYHVSLHEPMTREDFIKTVGSIGIKLLYYKNSAYFKDSYIDIVLDENLKPLYTETLEFLSMYDVNDMMSVFTSNGIDRLESITRGIDNLIVFKGSFNPPSIAHLDIIKKMENMYENSKAVFCLSYNTFQKGKQSVESFSDRIQFLIKLGYDVIVNNKPLFTDAYNFIRLKYSGKIVLPQGVDTINRMSKDYIIYHGMDNSKIYFHTKGFKEDFKNVDFHIFNRGNDILLDDIVQNELVKANLINVISESEHDMQISSTLIRDMIKNGNFKDVKELIPSEIYDDVINKKF